MARPGNVGIATRRVAILVADGVDGEAAMAAHEALAGRGRGAALRRASSSGASRRRGGDPLDVEVSMETAPSVLWDGVIVPGGAAAAAEALAARGHAIEFLKDQYRHCKPMLAARRGGRRCSRRRRASRRRCPAARPIRACSCSHGGDAQSAVAAFAEALAQHRHFERETDPPLI